MYRFSAQLFGVTVFALALIWFADPGDASQVFAEGAEPVLEAETVHIQTQFSITSVILLSCTMRAVKYMIYRNLLPTVVVFI